MRINLQLFGGRGASSNSAKSINSKIKKMLDDGNVFDFGVGPRYTTIAFKRHGIKSFSEWDAPITLATKDGILKQLKIGEEATAKVWDDQVKIRTNYFKRNGYKVIGEKQEEGSATVYLLVKREK